MGISTGTLYQYQHDHPDIAEALKRGKAPADIEVENALFKRATGSFTVTETTEEIYEVDGVQRKHIRKVTKEMPPDVTAQIFWLKNRKPIQWRDRREVRAELEDTATHANAQITALADLLNDAIPAPDISQLISDAEVGEAT